MRKFAFLGLALLLIILGNPYAYSQQTVTVIGRVTNERNEPVNEVNVYLENGSIGTGSRSNGRYRLNLPTQDTLRIVFSHIQYEDQVHIVAPGGRKKVSLDVSLQPAVFILDPLQVEESKDEETVRIEAGNISIDPQAAQGLPSAFGDFSRVLATLPGVVSNNELSSSYSVRGGNFDENLVYVNDILVYRPFLIRAGQQEGLGFVNPNLVQGVNFSSGGWQPKYGDKLSSSLNIAYKEPTKFSGSGTLGTLGGSAHLEGSTRDGKVSSIFGVRHKNSRYLLNTLDTDGEYFPRFTDVQSFTTFDLGDGIGERATDLNLLLAYSQNRYLVEPDARETDFGTFNRSFRLFVAFDGREISEYDTYQAAVKLNHNFNRNLRTSFIISGVKTLERELFEVEGGYRLCDLNTDPGSAGFNECAVTRGIGTDYSSGRNTLDARIINIDNRSAWLIDDKNRIEFGAGYANEDIADQINEYNFTDSANFSSLGERINNSIQLNTNRLTGYLQHTFVLNDSVHYITYGVRLNYWDLNNQLLLSPRFQYAQELSWWHNTVFRVAIGRYVQPPFYRELRDRQGQINTDIKAQTSWHFIAGIDRIVNMWGRDFTILAEGYYKTLDNVIVYDIDDIRIRYFGNNNATAYAAGMDFRINGEFIPGAESWFSVGILKTEEDLQGDGNEAFRRPSDQRINLGIFFQDHIPNDPSYRVSLSFLYGSGLPFGPPNNDDFRNSFDGDQYLRADLGLSKIILFPNSRKVKSLWIGLDILNLFGFNNTISYTWVSDLNNNQFAVPNALSARFFNAKVMVNF